MGVSGNNSLRVHQKGSVPGIRQMSRMNWNFQEMQYAIRNFRSNIGDSMNVVQIAACHKNLLRAYRNNQVTSSMRVKQLAALGMTLPFVNALVESLFSTMGYAKSGSRSSLKDESVGFIMHMRDAEAVCGDVSVKGDGFARSIGPLRDAPTLAVNRPYEHELTPEQYT